MIAAVQAGGRSSRMGRDKAWLRVDGQPLISRVLSATRPVAAERLIVINSLSPNRERYADLAMTEGATLVFDQRPGKGPLGGIHAALRHCPNEDAVLIVACDLPFVSTQFLSLLCEQHYEHQCSVTVPLDQNGRLQPLVAIYAKDSVSRIEEHLDQNLLRVDLLFDVLPTHYVVPADYAEIENAKHLFTNVNEPADMRGLLKIE